MKYLGTCAHRLSMGIVDVANAQTDLRSGCGPHLGGIEGEVKVSTLSPGDFGMTSTNPTVVHRVVPRLKVKTKPVSIESR
jgi:hypothetical protein